LCGSPKQILRSAVSHCSGAKQNAAMISQNESGGCGKSMEGIPKSGMGATLRTDAVGSQDESRCSGIHKFKGEFNCVGRSYALIEAGEASLA
jgi:hypothetical protein